MTRTRACLVVLFAVWAVPSFAQTVNDPLLKVETYSVGFIAATGLAFIGPDEMLVIQRHNGTVSWVVGGVNQGPALIATITAGGERGLLGITLDPDFQNNGFVYLYYTESDRQGGEPIGNRVWRYTWNGSLLVDPRLVLDLPAVPGPNHNAGIVLFGADDRLYAVIGDLNHFGKLENEPGGPDPDDTAVIFRVNPDGSPPRDNPFFSATGALAPMRRYFAYGVRNSYGLGVDPVTGALWDTENGPDEYDEINRVDAGFNSGWYQLMGPDARDPEDTSDLWVAPGSAYSDPEFSWRVPVAPTTIAFALSPKLGCDRLHDLLVGDANCGQLYHFELNPARDGLSFSSPVLQDLVADNAGDLCSAEQAETIFGSGFDIVTDIDTGPDGLLYVTSIFGTIYRIVPDLPPALDQDDDGVHDACDCSASQPGAWALPAEVPKLRVSGRLATRLGWDSQSAASGSGTTYTVVTGPLASLRADGGYASACTLAQGLTQPRLTDARPTPSPGAGVWWLVRAANACGAGTFGDGSGSPDPRDAIDAALPAACAP